MRRRARHELECPLIDPYVRPQYHLRLIGQTLENSFFRVSSSVQNTVSIREEFKYPADFIQIQPFLELNPPETLLNRPNCGGIVLMLRFKLTD